MKKIQSGLAILGRAEFHKIQYEVDKENPHLCTIDGSLYNKNKTRLIAVFPTEEKKFVVPKGVQIIEEFVFANLNIEQVTLPDTITTIKHRCFEDCRQLREITLPKSLKQLDFRAFDGCENLEKIKIFAETPPKLTNPSAACWEFMKDAKKAVLYVPVVSLEIYKKSNRWNDIKHIKTIN